MAKHPDIPCAGGCGKLLWRGTGSLPPGQATCRGCRAQAASPPLPPVRKPRYCALCSTPIASPAQVCDEHKGLRRRTCIDCGLDFFGKQDRTKCDGCHSTPVVDRGPRHVGGNYRRRARAYGVEYEPIRALDIHERDRWRCGLCGDRIDRKLKVPHPMSATLDHIVPLARGGGHTRANVQSAHFICNCRKRAAGSGEQLALLG